MECEFHKYGCTTRIANADHLQAHLTHAGTAHTRLLASLLDTEVSERKAEGAKMAQAIRTIKEYESRLDDCETRLKEHDVKFKEFEGRIADLLAGQKVQQSSSSASSAPSSYKPALSSSSSISPSYSSPSDRTTKEAALPSLSSSSSAPAISSSSYSTSASASTREKAEVVTPRTSASRGSSLNLTSKSTSSTPSLSSSGSGSSISNNSSTSPAASQPAHFKPADLTGNAEKGVLWSYNAAIEEWSRCAITFKMDKSPFAEGGLRAAYHLEIKSVVGPADTPPEQGVIADKNIKSALITGINLFGDKYVSKVSKKPVPADRYFEDVKMQAICAELGAKFNQKGVPKPIQFLPAWVLEIPKSNVYCGLEPFIEGEFLKLQNNYGAVLSERNTPQTFSHFTWEVTNHSLLVVDIQGVKDFYTDPQIHTKDGKGFGLGNLGMNGVDRFLKSHKCNAICQALNLPLLNLPDNFKKKASNMMKGTMKVPYIEDQLGSEACIKWEGPANMTKGEFQCVQTLTGHDDRVMSLCVGGKYLFSGTYDGVIKAWNLGTFTLETSINAHRKSVESMCANANHLFSASADHSIKAWDLNNNLEVAAQLRDHVGEVNAICLSDKALGYLASASFDKNIKIWNVRTFKAVQNLEGHTKAIKALAISGAILFSGSNDGSIMVWNLKYFTCLFTIDAHDAWVKALAVKDHCLFSAGLDHLVKEWDIVTFNNNATMSDHNDDVLALLVTDKFLVSASQDRSVLVYDYASKKVLATIKGHRSGGVQALATDGKHLFSGSDDYSVKIWKWVN